MSCQNGQGARVHTWRKFNAPGDPWSQDLVAHRQGTGGPKVAAILSVVGRALNSTNGFETIEMSTQESVDAVVLDLDHSRVEDVLIAREIKQRRPQLPVVVLRVRRYRWTTCMNWRMHWGQQITTPNC